METTINERIALLVTELGYRSNRAFSIKIGIAQTSFNALIQGSEPKFSTLNKILTTHPTVSAEWLMLGKGEVLKSDVPVRLNTDTSSEIKQKDEQIAQLLNEVSKQREQIGKLINHLTK